MIADFLTSWELFHYTYLAGGLIALLLSTVGAIVVARDQIFVGAAASQASTLGISLGMQLSAHVGERAPSWLRADGFVSFMAVAFCITATLFSGRGGEHEKESSEATTGWVFLLASSLSVLIASRSPHGMEEIQRLLSSSLIGASEHDVWVFALLLALTIVLLLTARGRILLLAMDPSLAHAVGMSSRRWRITLSCWLGLSLGLSLRASGLLYAFGCLVLPALTAKNLCREVRWMFMVAPWIGLTVSVLGFVLANHWDTPPGQTTVALLCCCLLLAWLKRGWGPSED